MNIFEKNAKLLELRETQIFSRENMKKVFQANNILLSNKEKELHQDYYQSNWMNARRQLTKYISSLQNDLFQICENNNIVGSEISVRLHKDFIYVNINKSDKSILQDKTYKQKQANKSYCINNVYVSGVNEILSYMDKKQCKFSELKYQLLFAKNKINF